MASGDRRLCWAVGILVVLTATGIRLCSLPALFQDGRLRLVSGDSWYHLRRMALVADGAGLPEPDRWTHHPKGMVPHWPPLLDVTGGWLARAIGGGSRALDRVAGAGIALVGALTAAAFTLALAMAARRGGTLAGVVAVVALALSAGHHNYTRAGKIDHHVVESLAAFGALEAMLLAVAAAGTGRRAALALVAAASMAALIASVPSSSVAILLLAGATGLRVALIGDRGARSRAGLVVGAAFAIAGLTGVPLAWASPMTRAGLVVSHDLSLLQPMMLLAAAAGFAVTALVPARSGWVAVAAGATVGAALLLAWPAGRAALLEGYRFVGAAGFVVLIDESRSAAAVGWGLALQFLSLPVLLVPVLCIWAGRTRDADLRVLAAVLAATALLALVQLRFVMLLALPLAVVGGLAGAAVARRRGGRFALAGALLLLVPALPFVLRPPATRAERRPVWRALAWLRANTPSAGDPWRAGSRPAYAVMAPWGFGHEVLVLGERANVASPFIAPRETEGVSAALRFFLATDPREAESILRAHDTRWVLTVPTPAATLARYAVALGADPSRIDGETTTAVALHARNGSAIARVPAAHDHLRLRFVDGGEAVKLFEYVAGARIAGSGATPGSEVLVRVELDVEGRGWMWFAGARADGEGRFALRVPYATDGGLPGNVRVRRAALRTGTRIVELTIPEPAVAAGDTVALDLRQG